MSFSTINFNFNDIEEAQALAEIAQQKLETLEKFMSGDESVSCDATFSKVAERQHGSIHKLEVSLKIDGNSYHANATEDSFEQAIDEVRAELDKEIRRAKDKQVTLDKQAGREAKEQMQTD